MTKSGYVAAVDLGATSGRVMLGHLGADQLSLEEVRRFPNEPVRTADGLHWSILELYRNVLLGLRKAVSAHPELAGIGIEMTGPREVLIWSTRSPIMPRSMQPMGCSFSRSTRSTS